MNTNVVKGVLQGLMDARVAISQWHGEEQRCELANPYFLSLFQREDLLDKPLREVFSKTGDADCLVSICDRVYASGETFHAPAFVVAGIDSERTRYLDLTVTALREGAVVSGVLVLLTDVTEHVLARTRAEGRAQALEARLAKGSEQIHEVEHDEAKAGEDAAINTILLRVSRAITGLDLGAIVQAVTDEATSICRAQFGAFFYRKHDLDGGHHMLYALSGAPKSAFEAFPMPRNTAVFGPTLSGQRIVRSDDITAEPTYGKSEPHRGMPKGHLPVRSYLAVPVVSRSGQVLGAMFFGHERPCVFTPRDELTVVAIAQQAAVAMDNARLFELAQRQRALAEEASRTKDEFLATISHELRTPLQSILGWTHMLRRGSLTESAAQRALAAVERNAKAQAAIVEDVLDVSRIIAGKLRIEVMPVSLEEVVQAALETVRPAADAREIRLQAVIDPLAGAVMGDANRLQQVVWNLLSNAVKFSARGGRVYVHLRRDRSSVEVVVADDGQGIPKDFLPHMFERFRQIDSSSTRTSGGLGLGLSIVKHLVELHGGTISAESDGLGKGATVTVRIPIAPVSTTQVEPLQVEPLNEKFSRPDVSTNCPPLLEGLKVLVVDDEEDARDLLRHVLEHCKVEVLLAPASAEALAVLREHKPDVLLSDIGMPHEDGYALIEKVRALPREEGGLTPAVALTAYARAEDRTRALSKGFNHHVAKPVDPNELMIVIASLVSRWR